MSLRTFPNHLGKYTLDSIDTTPFCLEEGAKYIIVSWNSNTHITATGRRSFTIDNHFGQELEIGKEYLWNKASDQPMVTLGGGAGSSEAVEADL